VELPSSRWVACSVYSSTLKMESEWCSEISVNLYQT
jgi:hypothetical protein